jgi:hypothetical protein
MTKVNQSLNRALYTPEENRLPCLGTSCYDEVKVPPKEVKGLLEPKLLKTPTAETLSKMIFAIYVPGVRANLTYLKYIK